MAKVTEKDEEQGAAADDESPAAESSSISEPGAIEAPAPPATLDSEEAEAESDEAATGLGATRYVHAAFFGAGMLVAFVSGKLITLLWHSLAGWPAAVRVVPQLLAYGEGERETFGLAVGALIGIVTVIQTYRKEHIRRWANEVAAELAKVTWPNRETVTNGTIVVVIASMIATTYVALLDRFWGFVTNLVYGA